MMKYVIPILAFGFLNACNSTSDADYLFFANDAKYLKEEFLEGMKKGCETTAVETVAHFDRNAYCDCMIEYVKTHSREIDLGSAATDAQEVGVDLVSYFDTETGAAQVRACRDQAIDESKFDWTEEEVRFRAAFPPKDTGSAVLAQHKLYLDCAWQKVKDRFTVTEMIDPLFPESAKLKSLRDTCAAEVGYTIPE